MTSSCFIIAEIGVNHNGDPGLARELVEAAARGGADAVKFQSFSAAKLIVDGTPTAAYQKANSGDSDQAAMLRRLELSEAMHRALAAQARELSVEFLSTPFDADAVDMLVGLGVRRLKVSSGDLTNHPLVAHMAGKDLHLVVSTGMATLDEVGATVEVIEQVRRDCGFSAPLAEALTLLHCTSNYPTSLDDVNLKAMLTLRSRFGVPTGYSDHTEGIVVAIAAAALGASLIEKHFTLDRSLPGPDQKASITPSEFAEMVRQIRSVERALGDGLKTPRASELPVRALVRRSIVAARDIPPGTVVAEADLALRRPADGMPPDQLSRLLGRRSRVALAAGTLLRPEHFV